MSDRRLSICMISDDFAPAATGVGVHLNLVAPELVRRGHRVTVVTSRGSAQPVQQECHGVRVHRMPTLRVYGFAQAMPTPRRLRQLFEADRPDLVHHHYAGWMMLCAARVAAALGLPQVSTYHFGAEVLTHPPPLRPFRPLVQRLMVNVNNRCRLVISPSSNLIPALQAMGITVPIRHVDNPVAFGPIGGIRPEARQDGFAVLFAGRFGPEKNVGLLLRAFALALPRLPPAWLWLAGQGPEEPSLRQLTDELGIGDRVQFLGFLDHDALARRYTACDLFVLPSVHEVQPLVAMEAMWFGRPVILTSALAAAAELVIEGHNGYIVDPQDAAGLAERLVTLAGLPLERERMGRAGRERAESFSPDAVVRQLEETYRDVVR